MEMSSGVRMFTNALFAIFHTSLMFRFMYCMYKSIVVKAITLRTLQCRARSHSSLSVPNRSDDGILLCPSSSILKRVLGNE
jgi:hypothetical protein